MFNHTHITGPPGAIDEHESLEILAPNGNITVHNSIFFRWNQLKFVSGTPPNATETKCLDYSNDRPWTNGVSEREKPNPNLVGKKHENVGSAYIKNIDNSEIFSQQHRQQQPRVKFARNLNSESEPTSTTSTASNGVYFNYTSNNYEENKFSEVRSLVVMVGELHGSKFENGHYRFVSAGEENVSPLPAPEQILQQQYGDSDYSPVQQGGRS